MGWEIGYDLTWQRDIGYGVPALCDHPGCTKKINRGLSHVCGKHPYGGDRGCGLYFCEAHLSGTDCLCLRCRTGDTSFAPKPDVQEWLDHKATHESWAEWRKEQGKGKKL